jgi:hypothetical protein
MSIRGGKTRANKRPFSMRQTTGDDSHSRDIRTLIVQQPGYRPVLPKEQSPVDFDTQDVAILTMQPDSYRSWPVLQTTMPNPYSREGMAAEMGYMYYTPVYDDANVEWPVFPHEVDVDNGSDTKEPQPNDPAQQVLGVDYVWKICMYVCQPILFIHIYLYMFLKFLVVFTLIKFW